MSALATKKSPAKPEQGKPRSVTAHHTRMGSLMRLRRVELKISQADLGRELGVSFQQIQKYEKGVNRIDTARLELIAAALKVPVTFFYPTSNTKAQEMESLLVKDPGYSLRLFRAMAKLPQNLQRKIVDMVECIPEEMYTPDEAYEA